MDATIYLNTTTLVARAAETGIAVPAITARLQAHLKLTCYFFATGEDPALLDGATFRVALKDVNEPSGTVLALLSAPTDTGADYYEFEWASLDSDALRTLLGDAQQAAVVLEIEWTIGSTVERVSMPATIENAWIRTTDAAPDPAADASWEWLKESIVAGANITRTIDDEARTITFEGEAGTGSGDVNGPASSTNSNVALFDGTTGKAIKDGGTFASLMAAATTAASSKSTPVDADEIPLADSAASFGLKKLTWANIKTTLNAVYQSLSANLSALAGLTSAANKLPYFTGSGTAAVTDLSSFGRNLIDDADAATARSTLELGFLSLANNIAPNQITASNGNRLFGTGGTFAIGQEITVGSGLNLTSGSLTVPNSGITDSMLAGSIAASKLIGTDIATVGTITAGTWNGTTIAIANGGTGQTSQTAAFDALAPTTTKGDLIVSNGTDNVRLPVGGTNGHVLTVDSAEAAGVKWAAASGGGGKVAQIIRTQDSTAKSSTATMPSDDTIPQNTEGTAYTEIETTITPTNASSYLLITVELAIELSSTAGQGAYVALFKDSDVDAIETASFMTSFSASGQRMRCTFTHYRAAAATSAQTYKVRFGRSGGTATVYLNDGPSPLFGGANKSSMTITEILP